MSGTVGIFTGAMTGSVLGLAGTFIDANRFALNSYLGKKPAQLYLDRSRGVLELLRYSLALTGIFATYLNMETPEDQKDCLDNDSNYYASLEKYL